MKIKEAPQHLPLSEPFPVLVTAEGMLIVIYSPLHTSERHVESLIMRGTFMHQVVILAENSMKGML